LTQALDGKEVTYTNEAKDCDDNVLHQIQKMFTFLEVTNRCDYNPKEFCYSFKGLDGLPTNLIMQQDAQDFLLRLFENLEEALKNTNHKYLLNSVFSGKLCIQMICQDGCKTRNLRLEDCNFISLEIKNNKVLKDALDKIITPEKIEDYKCDTCNKKVTLTKKSSFIELPNVIIFHLQRICFNYDSLMNEKINSRFEFPKKINMKDYCLKDSVGHDIYYEREEAYYDYELVGVVVHVGFAESGHYYSYINVKREGNNNAMNNNNEKWIEFNDSNIVTFNLKNLEEECFGGSGSKSYTAVECSENTGWLPKSKTATGEDNNKSAYMLVYERKKKFPLKFVLDKKDLPLSKLA
jgi:ubiquitin carboxyl-terminal hydrolase 34